MFKLPIFVCAVFTTVVYGGIIQIPFENNQNSNNVNRLFNVPREEVTFRLWTRDERKVFRPLYYGHLSDEDSIRTAKPFKIIIHGWTDYADKGWYEEIMNEYLNKEDVNVIGVDWKNPASALYPLSAEYTKDVGKYVSEFLLDLHESLKVPLENIHLIGHSLGAHICGLAGQDVEASKKAKIGRITGLDPAGPLFLLTSKNKRLSSDDATFVDIIHTDGGKLGMSKEIGHVDFYPNGGSAPQPGCLMYNEIIDTASCSHTRSYNLFRESINSEGFVAKECESYKKYHNGDCANNKMLLMGENIDLTAQGVYYLSTNSVKPFAQN